MRASVKNLAVLAAGLPVMLMPAACKKSAVTADSSHVRDYLASDLSASKDNQFGIFSDETGRSSCTMASIGNNFAIGAARRKCAGGASQAFEASGLGFEIARLGTPRQGQDKMALSRRPGQVNDQVVIAYFYNAGSGMKMKYVQTQIEGAKEGRMHVFVDSDTLGQQAAAAGAILFGQRMEDSGRTSLTGVLGVAVGFEVKDLAASQRAADTGGEQGRASPQQTRPYVIFSDVVQAPAAFYENLVRNNVGQWCPGGDNACRMALVATFNLNTSRTSGSGLEEGNYCHAMKARCPVRVKAAPNGGYEVAGVGSQFCQRYQNLYQGEGEVFASERTGEAMRLFTGVGKAFALTLKAKVGMDAKTLRSDTYELCTDTAGFDGNLINRPDSMNCGVTILEGDRSVVTNQWVSPDGSSTWAALGVAKTYQDAQQLCAANGFSLPRKGDIGALAAAFGANDHGISPLQGRSFWVLDETSGMRQSPSAGDPFGLSIREVYANGNFTTRRAIDGNPADWASEGVICQCRVGRALNNKPWP